MSVTSQPRVDILIDNALCPDGRAARILVNAEGQVIDIVTPESNVTAGTVHDVEGRLVIPAMADPHAHVDKALTADVAPNATGDLRGAIDAWIAAETAGLFTHDDMVDRIRRSLRQSLMAGCLSVRSHLNIGGRVGITHLEAALAAASDFRELMDIQFVAMSHNPSIGPGSEHNVEAINGAIAAGVEVIGGCPHLEPDPAAAVAAALDRAEATGRPVDLHTDETLDARVLTLELLSAETARRGLGGRVAASHCVSLGMCDTATQQRVADATAAAGVAVVALPQTNLYLQGRDTPTATPRGLTAVHALRAAGVTVAAGADNVQDPFNLVGRNDPLETAALMVMAGHLLPDDAFACVSAAARRTMGLPAAGPARGAVADLVALPSATVRAAVADAPVDRMVFRRGRLVADTRITRTAVI
jgi:cytosine deaminase